MFCLAHNHLKFGSKIFYDNWDEFVDEYNYYIENNLNGSFSWFFHGYVGLEQFKQAHDEAFDIRSEPWGYPVLSKEEADKQLKGKT